LGAQSRTTWWHALIFGALALGLDGFSWSQVAPRGYSGALNTPTARVLPLGALDFSLTNNNPELSRAHPGVGHFGSAVLGFGALPGLELASRLAYEGELQCNQFAAHCLSSLRDVSVNGKYQLPIQGPWNSRVALGFTDYGGAATHFRQTYGVGTARWNFLEGSIGFATGRGPNSLPQGLFKNGTLHVNERLEIKIEDDGRQRRAGVTWKQTLGPTLMLAGTLSRLTSGPNELQKNQFSLGLQWVLDGTKVNDTSDLAQPTQQLSMSRPFEITSTSNPPESIKPERNQPTTSAITSVQRLPSQAIADEFASQGFRDISVGISPDQKIIIRVEPVGWRKSRTHAIGAALGAWLRTSGSENERLELTLTYLQQSVLTLTTTRACAQLFLNGQAHCNGQPIMQFNAPSGNESNAGDWTDISHSAQFHPEFEFGLASAYTVGTEYGLVDHSIGLDVGWQMPLAKGVMWQGNAVSPLNHSDDFRPPAGYWKDSRIQAGVQSSLLSYQAPLAQRFWGQLSTGQIDAHVRGQQLNLTWQDSSTRFRVTGIQGYYRRDDQEQFLKPQLLSARYSVLPSLWSLDITFGQFYSGDRGTRVMSHHWFGDHRLTFYVRETATSDGITMPQTRFAGFEFTIPLGPKQSWILGPLSIRGRDQLPIGLSTKIGGKDNTITSGYGLVPMLRHGLNDILDHDRVAGADFATQYQQIRAVMREVVER